MLLSGHVQLQINNPKIRAPLLQHLEGCAPVKYALGAGCYRYECEEESLISQAKDTRKGG
jgi:hypothetical protein